MISLPVYFCERNVYKITESSSLSINISNSFFNFTRLAFEISPSNTEFCTQCKYFLQIFNAFPTLFSPTSYTRITNNDQPSLSESQDKDDPYKYIHLPKICLTTMKYMARRVFLLKYVFGFCTILIGLTDGMIRFSLNAYD